MLAIVCLLPHPHVWLGSSAPAPQYSTAALQLAGSPTPEGRVNELRHISIGDSRASENPLGQEDATQRDVPSGGLSCLLPDALPPLIAGRRALVWPSPSPAHSCRPFSLAFSSASLLMKRMIVDTCTSPSSPSRQITE